MKTAQKTSRSEQGTALLFTLILSTAALLILAGAMSWSMTNTRQTERANSYSRSIAAAESATEKALTRISYDFANGGEKLVRDNLSTYRQLTPTSADSAYWNFWQFNDASGNNNRTFVELSSASTYSSVDSSYSGLKGFVTLCTVVSDAHQPNGMQDVTAGVLQQARLARIPIFQFAMYAPGDMEIENGAPLTITGKVHANGQLYTAPGADLNFKSDVTAVGDILYQRHPADTRGAFAGIVTYDIPKSPHMPALYLPIGMSNSPAAVREIIQVPPGGEDPSSPLGRQRYYNLTDMLIVATDAGLTVTSGRFNGFTTVVPTNEIAYFLSTASSFKDWREEKTVLPIDIDVGAFAEWAATNGNVRVALGYREVSSIYVWDKRSATASTLPAVRLKNGRQLPAGGLTVATARPIYVWGHYNEPNNGELGKNKTNKALPASLAGDSVTLLSIAWTDANSTLAVGSRIAQPTTVNAAILAGFVETTAVAYSGGMENFPRFMETWGPTVALTYNGSMVRMFPSFYATNVWGKTNVYSAPKRDWAYDLNFDDPTKLPPVTPSLTKVSRSFWTTVAPNQTTAVAVSP